MSDNRCIVKIPLQRRTKNHLGSMYFGALTAGADLAGGLIAMHLISKSAKKINFVFKSVNGEFLRRVHNDAIFTCNDGEAISNSINKALESGERVHIPVIVTVTTPDSGEDEISARFEPRFR